MQYFKIVVLHFSGIFVQYADNMPCLFTLWWQIDKQELPPDVPTVSASSSSHSQTNTPPPRQATPTSSFDRVTPSNSDTQVTKPVHPVQPTVKSGTYNTLQSGSGSYTQPQVYSRSSDQQGICPHFCVAAKFSPTSSLMPLVVLGTSSEWLDTWNQSGKWELQTGDYTLYRYFLLPACPNNYFPFWVTKAIFWKAAKQGYTAAKWRKSAPLHWFWNFKSVDSHSFVWNRTW